MGEARLKISNEELRRMSDEEMRRTFEESGFRVVETGEWVYIPIRVPVVNFYKKMDDMIDTVFEDLS